MPPLNVVAPWVVGLRPWLPVYAWFVVVASGAGLWVVFAGQHRRMVTDHELAWLSWHWFSGGRLVARRYFPELDDARPRVARAGRRAGFAVVRTAAAGTVVAAEYVRSGSPRGDGPATVVVAGVGGAVALTVATWVIVWAAVTAAHYIRWVRPLHHAVHKAAGWPEMKRPLTYLRVSRNRADAGGGVLVQTLARLRIRRYVLGGGDGVVVKVARNFPYDEQHRGHVAEIVIGKLDLHDVKVTWVPHGRHFYVQFRPQDQMPERAMFSDPAIRRLLDAAKPSAPVIGVTRGGKPVAVDLDTESPHLLLSAGTGGGKSSTITTIAAQLMRHGADVTILDVKRHSHPWARALPGVTYARDLGEIHRVLVELGQLGHERNRAWDDIDIDEQGPIFRRHVIVCEELNATMSVLRDWWKEYRQPDDPKISPAVRSLGQILFMGRAVRIHVLAIAQMATAKDMGGPEMRENFATRILARYTERAWRMLVPECDYTPATRHLGRVQVCIGGVATPTQVIYMTPREARAFVAEQRGLAAGDVAVVAGRGAPVSLGEQGATVAARPALAAVDGVPLLSLSEASIDRGHGIVALRHDALRQAALRDPEFPSPISQRGTARLYHPHHLQRWETNRPMAGGRQAPDDGRNEGDEVDRMEAREDG